MNTLEENISVGTIDNKELPIRIPGEILPERLIRSYTGSGLDFDPNTSRKIFTNLFAPLTEALYFEDIKIDYTDTTTTITNNSQLKILMAAVVRTSKKLTSGDFSFYYHFTYNSSGNYQLNFYITFDKSNKAVSDVNSYASFPFEVTLTEGSIKSANGASVPLDSIKTVQVFLINEDPETTRGTETTVQPGTGD